MTVAWKNGSSFGAHSNSFFILLMQPPVLISKSQPRFSPLQEAPKAKLTPTNLEAVPLPLFPCTDLFPSRRAAASAGRRRLAHPAHADR